MQTVNVVARAVEEMLFLLTHRHFARPAWNALTPLAADYPAVVDLFALWGARTDADNGKAAV